MCRMLAFPSLPRTAIVFFFSSLGILCVTWQPTWFRGCCMLAAGLCSLSVLRSLQSFLTTWLLEAHLIMKTMLGALILGSFVGLSIVFYNLLRIGGYYFLNMHHLLWNMELQQGSFLWLTIINVIVLGWGEASKKISVDLLAPLYVVLTAIATLIIL